MNGKEENSVKYEPTDLEKVIDAFMRKRKLWLLFIFCFMTFSVFYFSILRIKFHKPLTLENIDLTTDKANNFLDVKNVTATTTNSSCPQGEELYGVYCAFSLFLEDQRDVKELGSVTLSTQGTVEFLHHVPVLCNRWGGPMSVAVFSPVEDYVDARQMIDTIRQCDFCSRHWVSWHIFFRKQDIPLYVSENTIGNCSVINQKITTKRKSQGPYPINVGRNLARRKTRTPYVFSIDIELYPCTGILPKFERMLLTKIMGNSPEVWVFPVFEVVSKSRAPTTKYGLKVMYAKKQAISFHKFRCDLCHRIPNLTEWLNHEAGMKSEVNDSLEELKIFSTVQRSRKFNLHTWEPFFIGTKEDPEFDIRLSWEGKQNKMQVAYEMCLKKYNFHIVSNAFLVHAPGINYYKASKERNRVKYLAENQRWISVIKKKLTKKYGPSKDC